MKGRPARLSDRRRANLALENLELASQGKGTPERILQSVWAFAPPLAIEAAIRHRVFDVLASIGHRFSMLHDCIILGLHEINVKDIILLASVINQFKLQKDVGRMHLQNG